jgi:hypothetical protein
VAICVAAVGLRHGSYYLSYELSVCNGCVLTSQL